MLWYLYADPYSQTLEPLAQEEVDVWEIQSGDALPSQSNEVRQDGSSNGQRKRVVWGDACRIRVYKHKISHSWRILAKNLQIRVFQWSYSVLDVTFKR